MLALVLLLTTCIRWRLRDAPLERDEGEYAYAGQLMLEGIPPYRLAYNMKFPGTYVAYALIMAAFGQTPAGIHLGLCLVNAAAIVLVWRLTSRLADPAAGLVAAALYAYASLSAGVVGTSAHATHFVAAAALGGLLLLLRGIERGSSIQLLGSGALLGIAVLMKQHGMFLVLFAGAYLIYCHATTRHWRKLAISGALWTAGVLLPLAVTGLWLWQAGVFAKFWFWTISYAREYAAQYQGLAAAWQRLRALAPNTFWVALCAALPGLSVLWRRPDRRAAVFAGGFLGASLLAMVPGFNFWWHYFILPLPALSLLTGVAVSAAAQAAAKRRPPIPAFIPYALFAAILLGAIFAERDLFFRCAPEAVPRLLYGPAHPFRESVQVAEYLRAHSRPGARIAVFGSEPQIYFYARRHSATGYIYTYGLMEPQPYALQMQREMVREVEAARPEYLVWIGLPASWLPRPDSPRFIFEWLGRHLLDHYDLVGAVDMSGREAVYLWDREARVTAPGSSILVYRRRAGGASPQIPSLR